MPDRFHELVQSVPCPQCLAPVGERCRTRRGGYIKHGSEHLARLKRAYQTGLVSADAAS